MRKKEFNHLYAKPDPWGVSGNKNSRNYVLKKIFKKYLNKDNKVL